MKDRQMLLGAIALAFMSTAHGQLAGDYADRNLLHGYGTVQVSVQQTGEDVSISFYGRYNESGHAGSQFTATGKARGTRLAEFEFEDSCGNTGVGAIIRFKDVLTVSIKAKHIADSNCLVFYQGDMHLKPVAKK